MIYKRQWNINNKNNNPFALKLVVTNLYYIAQSPCYTGLLSDGWHSNQHKKLDALQMHWQRKHDLVEKTAGSGLKTIHALPTPEISRALSQHKVPAWHSCLQITQNSDQTQHKTLSLGFIAANVADSNITSTIIKWKRQKHVKALHACFILLFPHDREYKQLFRRWRT